MIGRDRYDRYDRDRRRDDATIGIGPGGVTIGPRHRCRLVTTTIERGNRTITRRSAAAAKTPRTNENGCVVSGEGPSMWKSCRLMSRTQSQNGALRNRVKVGSRESTATEAQRSGIENSTTKVSASP
jgi:hypothetical protein